VEVAAGDLLYVPRGVVHEAVSLDSTSLHLAVGILGIAWIEVIKAALDSLAARQPGLRQVPPPGFAGDDAVRSDALAHADQLLEWVSSELRGSEVIAIAADRAELARTTALDGHLLDLEAEPRIGLNTPLKRRGGRMWRVTNASANRMVLASGGRRLSMPAYLEQEVRWLVDSDEPLTAGAMPGDLTAQERLTLVRRLLREGFMTTGEAHGQVDL